MPASAGEVGPGGVQGVGVGGPGRAPRTRTELTLGKHDATVRTLAEPLLQPGEEVIEVVLVNYNGTEKPSSLPGSTAPPTEATEGVDPDLLVTFPSARQMALALTGGRLMVWNLGMTGKPKNHLGDVPLSAVTEVARADVRFGGVLRIALRSGAKVDVEILRGEPAESFAEQLEALVNREE